MKFCFNIESLFKKMKFYFKDEILFQVKNFKSKIKIWFKNEFFFSYVFEPYFEFLIQKNSERKKM